MNGTGPDACGRAVNGHSRGLHAENLGRPSRLSTEASTEGGWTYEIDGTLNPAMRVELPTIVRFLSDRVGGGKEVAYFPTLARRVSLQTRNVRRLLKHTIL